MPKDPEGMLLAAPASVPRGIWVSSRVAQLVLIAGTEKAVQNSAY